jgi:beta-lactamase class A
MRGRAHPQRGITDDTLGGMASLRMAAGVLLLIVCASAAPCGARQPGLQRAVPGDDPQLDSQLKAIAAAHHGKVAVYAHDLRTGRTAALAADEPVKTASTIKLGILLDAAEQIRAGMASFDDKLTLAKENQVPGSGVLGQLTAPLTLTLRDVLHLMVVVSDNTAADMAIDRLGLAHINATLQAAGLKQTVLYKKVFVPAASPMPPEQPKFGLGKTTAREMAAIMERFAECRLALDGSAPKPDDGPLCGAMLHMLRSQQDRDGIPRYIEALDTSELGSAIANKTGALDQVRNDVALIATRHGPIVIAAFTWDNADQRWTGDNDGLKALGRLAQAVIERWAPDGLDAGAFPWTDPLAPGP